MTILITLPSRLAPEKIQETSLIKIERSMGNRHLCPCCSRVLLRHICLGKLYWRCNYCYQSMPVMEDARERPLFLASDASFQQELMIEKPCVICGSLLMMSTKFRLPLYTRLR